MNGSILQPPRDQSQTWNVLCHLSALLGLIFPLGFIVGPLAVWLMKRGEFPSVDIHGKEALNFQLSCLIYMAVSLVLALVLIGFLLLTILAIFDIVMVIVASVKASEGNTFHYPFTIRLIQ